ncbi:MAG: hypothetical protein KKB31_06675 [Nanoarchaeota archaeon]|nr:hypothetical protein [Nanoarchaeota archaeon]
MSIVQQLREEVYDIAMRKLVLETELKTMNFHISVLKKELDKRMAPQF